MGERERHRVERVGDGLVDEGGTDQLVHGPSLRGTYYHDQHDTGLRLVVSVHEQARRATPG